MRQRLRALICFAVVGLIYLAGYHRLGFMARFEPDTYFHLAMARAEASQGIVHSVPQAEDLGWGKNYPEPYFLFTWICSVFYRCAGEAGTMALVPLLSLILLLLLFRMLRRYVPDWGAALILVAVLMQPYLFNRLSTLRPHLLAMIFTLVIVEGYLARLTWVVALGALGYALTYHAIYLPLTLLGLAMLTGKILGQREWVRASRWGAGALLLGLLINPYFPENLSVTWLHLKIALHAIPVNPLERPMELQPWHTDIFLLECAFFLLAPLFAMFYLGRSFRSWPVTANSGEEPSSQSSDLALLLVFSLLGWGMTLQCPRGLEYAIPFSAILLGCSVYKTAKGTRSLILLFLLALGLQGPVAYKNFVKLVAYSPDREPTEVFSILDSIPQSEAGKKIFNCSWEDAPYILYRRPDLRFVDISDPSYLLAASPIRYQMREKLLAGQASYPYGLVRFAFRSDYLLCRNRSLIFGLEHDPNFIRRYPRNVSREFLMRSNGLVLYEARVSPVSNFIKTFEVADASDFSPTSLSNSPSQTWREIAGNSHLSMEQRSPWLSFAQVASRENRALASNSRKNPRCVLARPQAQDLATHQGSTWLGIGGGDEVHVWLNEHPLVAIKSTPWSLPPISVFTPLPKPLRSSDRLVALICEQEKSQTRGVFLSLWSQPDLTAICAERGAKYLPPSPREFWPALSEAPENCLAPYAVVEKRTERRDD